MNKKTYRQLTPEQRHTIQTMRQAGNSQAQIARDLHRAASTISRELRRNADAHGDYDHAGAQQQAMQRRALRQGHRAATRKAWPMVVGLLSESYTASHVGLLRWVKISERSCYRLIATDRAEGGQVYRRLPRGRRPRRRVCRHRRGPIPNRRDISERPQAADDRRQFGHWEGDLIEGRSARSYLLVLRERKSRWCRIQKLPNKRSDTVSAALMGQLKAHLSGLLTYFKHRITNALTEGFNSKIQAIKADARGFRRFENYRTRILFFCGKLDMAPLVHSPATHTIP